MHQPVLFLRGRVCELSILTFCILTCGIIREGRVCDKSISYEPVILLRKWESVLKEFSQSCCILKEGKGLWLKNSLWRRGWGWSCIKDFEWIFLLHLSVIVLPYFVGRPRLDRQEGRLKVSQVPVTEWFHLDLHVLTFRTCSITPLSGGFLD